MPAGGGGEVEQKNLGVHFFSFSNKYIYQITTHEFKVCEFSPELLSNCIRKKISQISPPNTSNFPYRKEMKSSIQDLSKSFLLKSFLTWRYDLTCNPYRVAS